MGPRGITLPPGKCGHDNYLIPNIITDNLIFSTKIIDTTTYITIYEVTMINPLVTIDSGRVTHYCIIEDLNLLFRTYV